MRIFSAMLAVAIAAPAIAIGPPVRLDEPGAMDAVRRDNPEHYLRISAILEVAGDYPCHTEQFARAIEAKFDAREGGCSVQLMTSYPAKRTLTFTLGPTRYLAVIRMKDGSKLMPAK